MALREKKQRSGSNASRNPKAERRAKGGPGKQEQGYPGYEDELSPAADHGEDSYRGSGKLEGLKALITGGDSGIGRAVAIAFAREGADVAISYLSEDADARTTVEWIEEAGRRAFQYPGDVSEHSFCRQLVQQSVKELGGLDILVNNAAFQWEEREFEKLPPEQLEHTFRTNFFAYFWLAQEAVRHMKQGAVIINTGSVTAMEGNEGLIDYSATKGAIHAFTKSLAQSVVERGVRVNCVSPGPVWTPLNVADKDPPDVARHGGDTPMKRPAQPEEIAPAFVFFASNADSSYITGEVMTILGGETRAA